MHVGAVQARTPLQIGPRVGPVAHWGRFNPEQDVSTVPQVSFTYLSNALLGLNDYIYNIYLVRIFMIYV